MSGIRRKRVVDLQMAWSTVFAPTADQRRYRYNAAGFAQVTPLTAPFHRIPLIPVGDQDTSREHHLLDLHWVPVTPYTTTTWLPRDPSLTGPQQATEHPSPFNLIVPSPVPGDNLARDERPQLTIR